MSMTLTKDRMFPMKKEWSGHEDQILTMSDMMTDQSMYSEMLKSKDIKKKQKKIKKLMNKMMMIGSTYRSGLI